MGKSYIESMKKHWNTSQWHMCVCGFLWDDWYRLSEEEQKQFNDELQIVAKKYKEMARKEGEKE